MDIFDRLLQSLDFAAEVRDVRLGLLHSAVLTRRCGLASTLTRDALKQARALHPLVRAPGQLLDRSARELVELCRSERLPEAAIGMAAINSLLEVDEDRCRELNAGELLAERGAGKRVAVVGHFPFVPRLREAARELWVIEANPRPGDAPARDAETLVPRADAVGITGTAFTNHTIEHLLALCRPDAFVVVLGDTTPLSPVLFELGVDAVCGTLVTDARAALRCVSQGANLRQIAGKRLVALTR